jgi:peptidoglycan/xylan/chitin deacetylase (PgdA/CDA1 family)
VVTLSAMWTAGIGWRGGDFEVAVVDRAGAQPVAPASFDGARVGALIDFLRDCAARAGGALDCVVDSTNGAVDGHLMAAGLRVHRADPWSLPDRPPHGSVPARVLAGVAAAAGPAALTRLAPGTGSIAGRDAEYAAHVAGSADAERELIRQGRYLTRGGGERPEVSLTFDDGPHPVYTPQILDILDRYGAAATFFCVGLHAAAHPGLLARIVEAGHGLGNHTWSHPYLPDLSRDEVLRQVEATGDVLARAAGAAPRLVRPPYGARTADVLRWLVEPGLTAVLWDVDARDWAMPGPDAIVANVTGGVTAGSVVLLHDAGGERTQTVAALPRILEALLERGFSFVPPPLPAGPTGRGGGP